mmetsp:Transcript_42535/g.74695  ORF Transcript_42535/g.74695 Transcript_42535/m.74695 type:complete len:524 (-) Transcript_42535:112-1683(-)
MNNLPLTILLLQLLAASGVRIIKTDEFKEEQHAAESTQGGSELMQEQRATSSTKDPKPCDASIATPSTGKSLQEHFDGIRVDAGLLDPSADFGGLGAASQCTKKDVCLLMRQLDMDFYQRAIQGKMTDYDYDNPPQPFPVEHANCHKNNKGFTTKPIMDTAICAELAGVAEGTIQSGEWDDMPTGCVVKDSVKTTRGLTGRLEVFMNKKTTDIEVTAEREELPRRKGSSLPPDTLLIKVKQWCVLDPSLSKASAVYYSPYKLKQSMRLNPAVSTSCSFGMMSFLAKLHQTKSNCAKILTYQPHGGCQGMKDCQDKADAIELLGLSKAQDAEKAGNVGEAEELKRKAAEEAAPLRALVEQVRQKFVLIDVISNTWCPGVWFDALQKANPDGVCLASRNEPWTADDPPKQANTSKAKAVARPRTAAKSKPAGGRLAAAQGSQAWETVGNSNTLSDVNKALKKLHHEEDVLMQLLMGGGSAGDSRPPKFSLVESSCDAFEDEHFTSYLGKSPEHPPDWYRDAAVAS